MKAKLNLRGEETGWVIKFVLVHQISFYILLLIQSCFPWLISFNLQPVALVDGLELLSLNVLFLFSVLVVRAACDRAQQLPPLACWPRGEWVLQKKLPGTPPTSQRLGVYPLLTCCPKHFCAPIFPQHKQQYREPRKEQLRGKILKNTTTKPNQAGTVKCEGGWPLTWQSGTAHPQWSQQNIPDLGAWEVNRQRGMLSTPRKTARPRKGKTTPQLLQWTLDHDLALGCRGLHLPVPLATLQGPSWCLLDKNSACGVCSVLPGDRPSLSPLHRQRHGGSREGKEESCVEEPGQTALWTRELSSLITAGLWVPLRKHSH